MLKYKTSVLVCLLLMFLNNLIFGKGLFNHGYLESRLHYGFVYPHHTSISYNIKHHVPGFEIIYNIPTYGDNIWEKKYRYPRKGFGLFHANMMNKDVLGSITGFYALMNIPLWKKGHFTTSYRINAGISYLNRIFDEHTNILNTAIGSHLNMYFRLGLDLRISFNNKNEFSGELGFTHFSNGNLNAPNLGLNMITVSGGFIHFLGNQPGKIKNPESTKLSQKYEFSFFLANGARTYYEFKDDYFYKSTLSLSLGRYLSVKRLIGMGTDIFYDGASKPRFHKDNFYDYTIKDLIQVGIFGFHDLVYKKCSFSIQIGYYLYKKNDHIFNMYNRTGLKYKFSERIFGIIALKSHRTQADYIELGIGLFY